MSFLRFFWRDIVSGQASWETAFADFTGRRKLLSWLQGLRVIPDRNPVQDAQAAKFPYIGKGGKGIG